MYNIICKQTCKVLLAGILLLIVSGLSERTRAQGCSDAGFCTVNSLKNRGKNPFLQEEDKNMLKVGTATGKADYKIQVYSSFLEYTRMINDRVNLTAKLTFMAQDGPEASAAGFGDIFLTGTYNTSGGLIFTGGLKIPLSDGNSMADGRPLPMDYQSSLGTLDLILGAGYRFNKLQFSVGYQQPLTQNNNEFFSFGDDTTEPIFNRQPTNDYVRKPDVLARLTYEVNLGEKLSFIPGLLPIYHLGEDEYTNEDEQKQTITGSSGLTLNGTLYLVYETGARSRLELNYGMPFITREARPDGLTRKYMMGVEYSLLF